jgi:hypothetical protein
MLLTFLSSKVSIAFGRPSQLPDYHDSLTVSPPLYHNLIEEECVADKQTDSSTGYTTNDIHRTIGLVLSEYETDRECNP